MSRGERSFFASRWVEPPAGHAELEPDRLAPGFGAAGVACGVKGDGGTDVGIVLAPEGSTSSMMLTRNASAAAPVRLCRDGCDPAGIRAAVVNSGNANASTGERGYRDAEAMQREAAERLGLAPRQVAVAETGTIGVPLPIDNILAGIASAAERVGPGGGADFNAAIMTTDQWPKRCCIRIGEVTISAQAKGAGMIEPGYATMLCFIQTDAAIDEPEAELRRSVGSSFERITVDGQMSTNDTVLLQASGVAEAPLPEGALDAILLQLALEIVRDGEGATRAGRVVVEGAADAAEAERVARGIANSPLVKTALYGRDPNWGRIAQAAGMVLAGERLDELGPDRIAAEELAGPEREAEVALRLDRGRGRAHVYFSDLTEAYVQLNAEYTT